MGMYDTIILAGPADAVRCAHGHEIRELQTKDLGEGMNTYYIWMGSLYRQARHGLLACDDLFRGRNYLSSAADSFGAIHSANEIS